MTVVDNGNMGTGALYDAHFMSDDDDGDAHLAVNFAQKIENRGRRRRVERTGCFVAEDNLRVGRQSTGDGNTLLLTAGKLAGIVMLSVRQSNDFEQFVNALFNLRTLHPGDFHREGNVAAHIPLREQVKMLENHRNLLAKLAQFLRAERGEILTVDDDVARCRLFQKVNAAHERRFARAGHADDSKNVALLDVQVDVFQGVYRLGFTLEGFCQVV